MTDRLKGFTVLLDHDIREDDAASIQNAIMSLRSVQSVTPLIATPDDWMARERVRIELVQVILKAIER